jgi:putative DNA primase/helicase
MENKNRKAFTVSAHREIALDRNRFYAVTDDQLKNVPSRLRVVSVEDIRWFIEEAGPKFQRQHGRDRRDGDGSRDGRDESGSGYGFHFMKDCKARGMTYAQAREAILADDGPAGEWAGRVDERQIERAYYNAPTKSDEELDTIRVSDVEMTPTEWIWPLRLARGKVTIFSGDPGLGKSQISTDIAARITTGGKWPDSEERAPKGSALIFAAEDAIGDTMRPRLEAAGADTRRVHVVRMVSDGQGRRRTFNLGTDLAMLERLIENHDDIRIVIVDPISAYMGDLDSHKITVVSPVFSQLSDFAERTGVAVLAIHHPPKDTPRKAIHAFSGSLAFVGGPRMAFVVAEDNENKRSLLLAVKNNLGPKAAGLGYRIKDTSVDHRIITSVIDWDDEPVSVNASEALRQSDGRGHKLAAAKEFLNEQLADGPMLKNELVAAAQRQGISLDVLKKAKTELGVIAAKDGFQGPWQWRLPRRENGP